MPKAAQPNLDADAKAKRARIILVAYRSGVSVEDIALSMGLCKRQVRRILRAAETGSTSSESPKLSPADIRSIRREHAADPAVIAWLNDHRVDRRHNGRPMAVESSYDPTDQLDDELDDSADLAERRAVEAN